MKVLVIRFSSIGDVTQALCIPSHIRSRYPHAEIHFLTKNIFSELMNTNPFITKTWTIKSGDSLLKMVSLLNQEKFDYVYDAHNNLRSNLFYFLVRARHKLQKPMERFKRFLLLRFKINKFEMPFSGQRDLLKPLVKWDIPFSLPSGPQIFLKAETLHSAQDILNQNNISGLFVAVAPSAAHLFKRWPVDKWKELFTLSPDIQFVVLAGPTDHFTQEFNLFPNVKNLTGKTSLLESAAIIQLADKVVSNDTGLLHFSEQLDKKTIALMGAAPFGFPSKPRTVIIKKDLPCWPCSKHGQGPCVNSEFHRCMNDITATEVKQKLEQL
ncbi:MAG: glycosyltransferase family 9 protein [Bdellovibrionaceae bacterium]|nr:glycosyltransferase family 9 protein [Pseudobdellovibrionaceae bacterium]